MPRDAWSSKKPPLNFAYSYFFCQLAEVKIAGEKKSHPLIHFYSITHSGFLKMYFFYFLNEAGIDRSDEMGHVADKTSNQHI